MGAYDPEHNGVMYTVDNGLRSLESNLLVQCRIILADFFVLSHWIEISEITMAKSASWPQGKMRKIRADPRAEDILVAVLLLAPRTENWQATVWEFTNLDMTENSTYIWCKYSLKIVPALTCQKTSETRPCEFLFS